MINWQLSKQGTRWPVSHDHIMGSSVELTKVRCFLKFTADQGMDFHWIAGSSTFTHYSNIYQKIEAPLLDLAKSIYYFTYYGYPNSLRPTYKVLYSRNLCYWQWSNEYNNSEFNSPFPSSDLPLSQNESSCKTFHMKMRLICMKIKSCRWNTFS